MDDLISRQTAIDGVVKSCLGCANVVQAEANAIQYIKKIPAAKARPIQHGKWEKKWHSVFKEDLPCCSICHSFMAFRWDYCPNCGSLMNKESE